MSLPYRAGVLERFAHRLLDLGLRAVGVVAFGFASAKSRR